MVLREAINQERLGAGRDILCCPRISDISHPRRSYRNWCRNCGLRAHGQLPPLQLDNVMNAFYEGAYDLLLSTNIVSPVLICLP